MISGSGWRLPQDVAKGNLRGVPDLTRFREGVEVYASEHAGALRAGDFAGRVSALWGLVACGHRAEEWISAGLASDEEDRVADAAGVLKWVGVPAGMVPLLVRVVEELPSGEAVDAVGELLIPFAEHEPAPGSPNRGDFVADYRPVTKIFRFVNAPFQSCVQTLKEWRGQLEDPVTVTECGWGFPRVLHRLEPLTVGRYPRELLMPCGGEWTAYFDCSMQGSGSVPAPIVLAGRMGVARLEVRCSPHEVGKNSPGGSLGSTQFLLVPPAAEGPSTSRGVAAHFESRWEWEEWGDRLPFEESEQYSARRIRDRLTPEMVGRYCQALGVDVFNPDFYGPEAVLFERTFDTPPPVEKTIAQVRAERGLRG